MTNYITKKGFERLRQELQKLQTEDIPRALIEQKEARDRGDVSENAELQCAKEEVRKLQEKARSLRRILSECEVVDISLLKGNKIIFGSTVTLRETSSKKNSVLTIVGNEEADIKKNFYAIDAPIVRAILHHQVGDKISYVHDNYKEEFTVLNVEFKELE